MIVAVTTKEIKMSTEDIRRFVNCESKTPVLKKYGETPEAKKAVKTRRSIEATLEARKLAKEMKDYE